MATKLLLPFSFLVGVALSACDAATTSVPSDGGPRSLELGTGNATFVSLDGPDASIEIVHGPQGGYHFPVTAMIRHLEPDNVVLSYRILADDDAVLASADVALMRGRLVAMGDAYFRPGDIVIFMHNDDALASIGHERRVRAELRRGADLLASDEHVVHVLDEVP